MRTRQLLWLTLAGGLILAAGLVQEGRSTEGDLWEVLPGRSLIVNYLWIRADQLQEQGRYYDAMQQSELICRLQRKFPGVWSFRAWNMAWNISVATHTAEERWRWVYNGLRLLRDEGIPLNPTSILLYKDLGWIFLFKIGDYLDDMHWVYKRQWATRMQDLLGAPPQGEAREVINAFRPIAEAGFLDKDPRRQGREAVQGDRLRRLLEEPKVAAYAKVLAAARLKADQTFLAAYNQLSLDEPVRVVRASPPGPETAAEAAMFSAVNDPAHAEARARLLAFLRAQILWNVYRMDPAYMLGRMELYGPLDWRLPQPHAIYWLDWGLDVSKDASLENIDALNTERNILIGLQQLTTRGRLTMLDLRPRSTTEDILSREPLQEDSRMDLPDMRMIQQPDLRFVEPTHQTYLRAIEKLTGGRRERFATSQLSTGHINYLVACIKVLYAAHRRVEAQRYLDWVRQNYPRRGPGWAFRDVHDFVMYELRSETAPSREFAEGQINISLRTALVALARGEGRIYDESATYAKEVYDFFQADRTEAQRLPAFEDYYLTTAATLLVTPRSLGYNLSLADRSTMYRSLPTWAQTTIYQGAGRYLKPECEAEGIDFDKAFPAPPGLQKPAEGPAPQPPPVIVP